MVPQRFSGGGVDHDKPEFVVHPDARAPTDPQTTAHLRTGPSRPGHHGCGTASPPAEARARWIARVRPRRSAPLTDAVHRRAGDVDQPPVCGDGRFQPVPEHGEPSGALHVRQVVGSTDVHVVLAKLQRSKISSRARPNAGAVGSHEAERDRGRRRAAPAGEEPAELGHDPGRAGPRVPLEDPGGPERTRQSQLCACRGADRQRGTINRGPRGRSRGRRSLRRDRRERGSGEQRARDRGGHRRPSEASTSGGGIGHWTPLGNMGSIAAR